MVVFGIAIVAVIVWALVTPNDPPGMEPIYPTWSAGTTPFPSAPSSGRAMQDGVNLPEECKVPGKISVECLNDLSMQEREAIRCANEDGNTDGKPCIWLDPDTRDLYYVTSEQYRN